LLLANLSALALILDEHNALSTDGVVLTIEFLFILFDNQVIWSVGGSGHWSTVAVQELDWHVGAMLSEEGDGLVTGLDGLHDVPAGSVLADEVSLSELGGLVAGLTLSLNDLLELVKLKGLILAGGLGHGIHLLFLFLVVLVETDLWLLTWNGLTVHVVAFLGNFLHVALVRLDGWQLGGVDNAWGSLRGLVRQDGQRVLSQLLVGIE